MSGAEVTAVVIAVLCSFALCVLLGAVVWLARAVRALNAEVAHLRVETEATIAALQAAVGHADAELDRADGLLDAAERITTAAESRARLTSDALATPVIKAMALASGTSRAAQRLRKSHTR